MATAEGKRRTPLRRHTGVSSAEIRARGIDLLLEAFVEKHGDGWWGLHGS